MIVCMFATSVLAKPLNNVQIMRGVFVYTHLNMANLIPFTKRFESSVNLVDLLESRGLQICDRNKAIQYLDNIGYYIICFLIQAIRTATTYCCSSLVNCLPAGI